ncbi:Hyaluronoglucosaminidase precursor [Paraliobacillus sp. PM-2]|uniref:beta-N-acetylglucosaminidase domain-containing protein n=1 Tax=Paraliobacillus sp. PM-2 TaxID=1462524 RepID=UPI00061C3079|nr:beta-N-acetylglucosaminidase domain-containing protein [Paraliobacillus sp. PM-2]CQR48057.1 Hyaluronoglucosaminidase precursor [Paraliobacillus sp. PM-2]
MKKSRFLHLLMIFTLVFSPMLSSIGPVSAASADSEAETYTIYPNPHELNYQDEQFELSETVNVVYESAIDSYTKQRVEEVLAIKNIQSTESTEIVEGKTNILVGTFESNGYVDQYFTDNGLTDPTLFEKLDSHIVSIDNNVIAILGKDVDSAFYGVTSVKHIFKQMQSNTIRELTIKDYADVKGRGFIEGYYGTPWSNVDRAELMKYGGEFKMNSYIYAPKDDPKHNENWRELYSEEELAEISKLAEAGNASKTRYVYALHTFMHDPVRFDTDAHYEEDLEVVKRKFTQLLDAGVRKFSILADDARVPAEGPQTYVRLMTDLTNWLIEQQANYEGLVTDMVFCPNDYMGWGDSNQIQTLDQMPESVSIIQTGGRVWGEVSQNFTESFTNNAGRAPYLWINWPCSDNSKQHLIMGGNEEFLHPNVNPDYIEGIVLNPMQQSEASKSAIFANADYAWNIWDSAEQAQQNWEDSFAYMDHLNINETPASNALKELSKHMINQDMDSRVVKLEESVELAPKLNAFKEALGSGSITEQAQDLITEFEVIRDAALTYKENPGNERTKDQIVYWLDSAIDTANAAISLLNAEIAHEQGDKTAVWENYSEGQASFNASKDHPFLYIDHYQYAEVGVQHIVPFIETLLSDVSVKVQSIVDPDSNPAKVITNRTDNPTGDLSNLLDNNKSSEVIYKSPSSISAGTFIGLSYEKPLKINTVRFELGRNGNDADTFGASKLQYTVDGEEWLDVPGAEYGHVAQVVEENLDLEAKGVRLIATEDRNGTWFAIKDIVINENDKEDEQGELQYNLIVPDHFSVYQGSEDNLFDGNDSSYIWYDPSGDKKDTSVVGDYIGVDLQQVTDIGEVYFAVGRDNGDKWRKYALEYSTDGETYTEYKTYDGAASGMDKVEEDLTGIQARYVRLRNLQEVNFWIKFSEIRVEKASVSSEYTYTNNGNYESISAEHTLENTSLVQTTNITLKPQEYVGVKLERLKELDNVTVNTTSDQLTLESSANEVEWTTPNEGTIARYVRLINNTDENITFDLNEFSVQSKEKYGPSFVDSDFGISQWYGDGDSRNAGTLLAPFDKEFGTSANFTDFQRPGQYITYSVGEPRIFNSLRVYNDENNINYIRDAKVQLSMDNENWTDVITLGDGEDNLADGESDYADLIADGYTHDSDNPGNYYYGNDDIGGIEAKYIRILITANYLHRFAQINEIVINDGEYVRTENNPTYVVDPIEQEGFGPKRLQDGDLTTAFKPNMTNKTEGSFTYRLSEDTDVSVMTFVQSSNAMSNATVTARVGEDEWVELGVLDESLNTIYNPFYENIFEIKLTWGDVEPVIYEMNTSTNKSFLPDRSSLETLLSEELDGSIYTTSSYSTYENAYAKANGVFENAEATQGELDDAVASIESAKALLVEKGDTTELTTYLDELKNLDTTNYTEASVDAFNESIGYVEGQLENKDDLAQDQVDALLAKLLEAEEGLVASDVEVPLVGTQVPDNVDTYNRENWTYSASSEYDQSPVDKMFDGDSSTHWHSDWTGATPIEWPYDVEIDLGEVQTIEGFSYLPRQDKNYTGKNQTNGRVDIFEIYAGNSAEDAQLVMKAELDWNDGDDFDNTVKYVGFDQPVEASYINFKVITADSDTDQEFGSGAEFNLYKEVVVDKSSLETAVSDAEDKVESDYTAASWNVFSTALAEANNVLANAGATQEEVNAAVTALNDSIKQLEEKVEEVNKSYLEQAISNTDKIVESDYTAESWNAFATALAAANATLADDEVTQEEVDAAMTALIEAKNNLEEKVEEVEVDKSALETAVTAAEKKVESDYTVDSWNGFTTALAAAKEVLANADATQDEVDKSIVDLEQSISALAKVSDGESSDNESTDNNQDEDSDSSELPDTATNMYTLILIGLIMMAIGFAFVIRRRKA